MGWDGNGNYDLDYNWNNDAANGIPITASRMQTQEQNIASQGFGNCVTRDGQGVPNAVIPLIGVTSAVSASSGIVGEYIEGLQTSLTDFPTSTQYGDLAHIDLTPGDWDVSAIVVAQATGSTTTAVQFGIGTASGNSATGLSLGVNALNIIPPSSTTDTGGSVPCYRVLIGAPATYYLKYLAVYSVATPQARGRISARRVR